MHDHRLEQTPLLSVPGVSPRSHRSWIIAASAAAAAVLILVLSVVVSSRRGSDTETATPPPTVTSSTLPTATNSQLLVPDATTAAPSADHTEQLKLLRRLAASVASHPSAGIFTDSSSALDGQAWTYSRTRKVPAEIPDVFAWYHELYPRAVVLSPVANGHAELKIATNSDANLAAYALYNDVQVSVVFDTDGESTEVTAQASGIPRPQGDTDRVPAARVVSATLDWFDGKTTRGGTRTLGSTDWQAAVSYLNAATVLVPRTSTGLPSSSTYVLTLTTDDGRMFKAYFNTSTPDFGVSLTIESVGQIWLDVDPAYYNLVRRLAGA